MNSEWQNFFSKSSVPVGRRICGTGESVCSWCLRDFRRACNAALHLKQNKVCRKHYGMIYTLKDQSEEFGILNDDKENRDEEVKLQVKFPENISKQFERERVNEEGKAELGFDDINSLLLWSQNYFYCPSLD